MESYVDDSKRYLTFPLKEASTAMAQLSEDLTNIAAWGRFLEGGINYTRHNSYSRDKSAILTKQNLFRGYSYSWNKAHLSLE